MAWKCRLRFSGPEVRRRLSCGAGQFSVADLAVAALLSITANPDHPDMKRPEPMFNTTRAWMDRWKDHPGTRWINEMYAKRRPA